MRNIDTIVVHCSDSPQGRSDNAATIHDWHKQRGFDGIGYHAVILEDGTIQNGRPDYWPGAHARGVNGNSLGVCLLGSDSFADAQMLSLKIWIAEKMMEHKIKREKIIGHYEVPGSGKTCPNFDVAALRDKL